MKRAFFVVPALLSALAVSLVGDPPAAAGDKPVPPKTAISDAPVVSTLAPMLDGFRWGMTKTEVVNAHNSVGGVFDKDFDPQLVRVQPGVQQKALENARDNLKAALLNSWIEFKDTPKGYDSTGIRSEYSYRNNEALLALDRNGKHRYFFFIGASPSERLWKIYDEIPLGEASPLGKTFQEAVTKLQGALAVPGRVRGADPSKGLNFTTVDWQDGNTHLRAVDRSNNSRLVAVVLEDRSTLNNIEHLRANKVDDPLAMDPSITAITRGGISDPNGRPSPSGSGTPKAANPKPAPPKR